MYSMVIDGRFEGNKINRGGKNVQETSEYGLKIEFCSKEWENAAMNDGVVYGGWCNWC